MQKKIMIHYILIILIGILITGMFSYHAAQRHYISEVESKLMVIGKLLEREAWAIDVLKHPESLDTLALKYGNASQTRVTFINNQGEVLGDSSTDYTTLENHKDRPEIIQAFTQGIGESTRLSTSIGTYLKYIAIRIEFKPNPIVVRLSIPIDDINDIRIQIISYILFGILIALIVASVLAVQFTNTFTKPIRQLSAFSKNIAKGNFSETISIDVDNELGELAQSLIYMGNELDKTITELWQRNIEMGAILDSMIGGLIALDSENRIMLINKTAIEMFNITNHKIIGENILRVIRNHTFNQFLRQNNDPSGSKKQQMLDIQYEDKQYKILRSPIEAKTGNNNVIGMLIIIQDITNIRKLEQMRSDFVSNVTHELKTPLTSIKGFIDTLRGGAIHDEEVSERFLDIIDIEAERLTTLIEDILELSEIETMKQDIRIQNYALNDIINEVVNVVSQSAEKKNIQIDCYIDSAISQIYVNKDRLKQMLINLVDNGIKYNNVGGNVEIRCKKFGKIVEFHISDNGIGISKEHLPRLFERFYRIDKGRSRNQGGTGLGLSIVKHIVNLYNGEIRVQSEIGKGTEFIIRLPIGL
ncbi:MAG: two-component system histidine kinase PnpS [Clostridia bacterium]